MDFGIALTDAVVTLLALPGGNRSSGECPPDPHDLCFFGSRFLVMAFLPHGVVGFHSGPRALVGTLLSRILRKSLKISFWFFIDLRGLNLLTVLG